MSDALFSNYFEDLFELKSVFSKEQVIENGNGNR